MTKRFYQNGPPVVSRLTLLQAFKDADAAWMAEVVSVFGERDARMARFQDRANGEPGTKLRELYNHFVAARMAYDAAG
jgi:hypothetical protein